MNHFETARTSDLSPRALRRRALAGMVAAAPAVYFVGASLLKFGIGIDLFYAPIEALTSTPGSQRIFNVVTPFLFIGGLAAACAMNVLPLLSLRTRWSRGDLVSQLRMKPRPINMLVAALAGGTLTLLLTYVAMENLHHLRFGP